MAAFRVRPDGASASSPVRPRLAMPGSLGTLPSRDVIHRNVLAQVDRDQVNRRTRIVRTPASVTQYVTLNPFRLAGSSRNQLISLVGAVGLEPTAR